MRDTPARKRRGLQAYQANAGALAQRALAAAFPTVQPLLGDDSFAALSRAFWQAQPPLRGDVATWGHELPVFIAAAEQLASEPYLADVARLDWAVHQAEQAADDDNVAEGLNRLSEPDPAALRLRLRAGHAVLVSAYPLHAIWQAHRSDDPDRFAPVRQAFAEQRAEAVRVRRHGYQVAVDAIAPGTAAFEVALLQRQALGDALALAAEADGEFEFEAWFIDTLRRHGLAAVEAV